MCFVLPNTNIMGLFTRKEDYPCPRVTLASGLKLAPVNKRISQVGLPLTRQLILTCFVMRDFFVTVQDLKQS